MAYVFYDTETTGLSTSFDQIVQFAAIVTSDTFHVVEAVDFRCRLLPHIVPSPSAMLATGYSPSVLQSSSLSHYQMVREIRRFIERVTPSTFIGFNNLRFDESLIRQALYQTLNPIFLTNTNGNSRIDALQLTYAVLARHPDLIKVAQDSEGKQSFRLGSLLQANNIDHRALHNAYADADATASLTKLLVGRAARVWTDLLACRSRRGVEDFLGKNDVFVHTNRFYEKPTIVAAVVAANPKNPSERAIADLSVDPAGYLSADLDQLSLMLASRSSPIRLMRLNAVPIVSSLTENETLPGDGNLILLRPTQIRSHVDFVSRIQSAMVKRHKSVDSPQVEQRMYERFPRRADNIVMEKFHQADWRDRLTVAREFDDDRYLALSNRLVFVECPDVLPDRVRAAGERWRRDRLTAEGDVPWRTIAAARLELCDLEKTEDSAVAPLLAEIDDFLRKLEAEVSPRVN